MKGEKDFFRDEIKKLFAKNKYDEALSILNEYLIDNKGDRYALYLKAVSLHKVGNDIEAEKLFLSLINDDIGNFVRYNVYREYGKMLFELKRYDEALPYLLDVFAYYRIPSISIAVMISTIYLINKEYFKALGILDIPHLNTAAFNSQRADIYYSMRFLDPSYLDDAIKAFDRPLEYDPEKYPNTFDAKARKQKDSNLLGRIYYAKGDSELAKYYYENALEIYNNKAYFDSLIGLARIYFESGDINYCLKACDEILKYCSNRKINNIAWSLIALIYLKNYDFDKALEIYENIDDEYVSSLGKAKIYITKKEYDKAEPLLDKMSLTLDNTNYIDYLYTKALLYFRLNRYIEFVNTYKLFKNVDIHRTFYSNELDRMKFQLELKSGTNHDCSNYYDRQFEQYDEYEAREETYNRMVSLITLEDDIDIDDLFDYSKEKINELPSYCVGSLDGYIINYKKIGYDKSGNSIDTLYVFCLADTKKIVIIRPFNELIINDEYKEIYKMKKKDKNDKFGSNK